MNALLVQPKSPMTLWSFEEVLRLINRKALFPPLGLMTVASLLPENWKVTLVDRNVRDITEEDWSSADLLMLTGMNIHRPDLEVLITTAKSRGIKTVVGGVYATSCPDEVKALGVDYLVLDEAEITIPTFLRALSSGATSGVFQNSEKFTALNKSPLPRFDLVNWDDYDTASVQFSRGCPYKCDFCDIPDLFGNKSRSKDPLQFIKELDDLKARGWNRTVFIVDDNFIGNRFETKKLLRILAQWQMENGYPFAFQTEASINLARDPELLNLMRKCRFNTVFIGIETSDKQQLQAIRKIQNTLEPITDSITTIQNHGMSVIGSFILGMDGETSGAGQKIIDTIETANIPVAIISILQALPGTPLYQRLQQEGRLTGAGFDRSQTAVFNFQTIRPEIEIIREYINVYEAVYEPNAFIKRAARSILAMEPNSMVFPKRSHMEWRGIKALLTIIWRQGVIRTSRSEFWKNMGLIFKIRRQLLNRYIILLAQLEHFLDCKTMIRNKLSHACLSFPQDMEKPCH